MQWRVRTKVRKQASWPNPVGCLLQPVRYEWFLYFKWLRGEEEEYYTTQVNYMNYIKFPFQSPFLYAVSPATFAHNGRLQLLRQRSISLGMPQSFVLIDGVLSLWTWSHYFRFKASPWKGLVNMRLPPPGTLREASTIDLKAFIHPEGQVRGNSELEDHTSMM